MKDLYILLISLFVFTFSNAQIVDIPDTNFKNALVNTLCVASEYQGDPFTSVDFNNDGEIQVSEAETIVHLQVSLQNISSLEGIEAFTSLKSLACGANQLSVLDMSSNTLLEYLSCGSNEINLLNVTQNLNLIELHCSVNNLQTIDVTQNTNLIKFYCGLNLLENIDLSQNLLLEDFLAFNNQISSINLNNNINLRSCVLEFNNLVSIDFSYNIDLSLLILFNNNLTHLDLSNNLELNQLGCDNNPLTGTLDLSQNENLFGLSCTNTLISSLNLRNGDNINLTRMWAQDNPNLTCIQVDDINFANSQDCDLNGSSGWCKDETVIYSEDCNLGIEDVLQKQISLYPNPAKDVLYLYNESISEISTIKVYDILGEQVLQKNNPINQIDISNLATGLLFVQIETDKGLVIKKIIKQ